MSERAAEMSDHVAEMSERASDATAPPTPPAEPGRRASPEAMALEEYDERLRAFSKGLRAVTLVFAVAVVGWLIAAALSPAGRLGAAIGWVHDGWHVVPVLGALVASYGGTLALCAIRCGLQCPHCRAILVGASRREDTVGKVRASHRCQRCLRRIIDGRHSSHRLTVTAMIGARDRSIGA